jgi:hypothetical protein
MRKRFKNETAFQQRNLHPNIVAVLDQGVANAVGLTGPFYVMRRYDSSLRNLIAEALKPDDAL